MGRTAVPAVSIIMPSYNRSYIIDSAIASVVAQTYPSWELIIIDDGSTDDTAQHIQDHHDPRIRTIYQSNTGPCTARNNGIMHARGTWLTYLDSDNQLRPAFLEHMLAAFAAAPTASYGIPKAKFTLTLYQDNQPVQTIDQSDQFPDHLTIQDIFHRRINFDMNGFMHRRDRLGSGITFDKQLFGMEDWDLVLQLGNYYPNEFLYIPEVLVLYDRRYGGDGRVSMSSYARQARKLRDIYRKHQHDALMAGQTWYPREIEEWQQRQTDYEAGILPEAYLFPFHEHWPKSLKPANIHA